MLNRKVDAYSSYLVVQLLKTVKQSMDYKALSKQTGLPVSTLTRYLTNKTLPRGKRTLELIDRLLKIVNLNVIIQQRLAIDDHEVDISEIVSESYLVELMVAQMLKDLAGSRIDCLLAFDRAGLIIATAFGLSTMKKVYYTLNTETTAAKKWVEIKYRNRESRTLSRLYVPVDVLKSHVLLTTGILDGFVPLKEILAKISEAKGDLVGIAAVASSKEFLKSLKPYQYGKIISFGSF
ncbi:MAG: hypothetical protein RMI49_01150 [Candidatus Caldarchaeum sp.]|nr:hypothetical protein [Candidatus Caldarchaeum sp.]